MDSVEEVGWWNGKGGEEMVEFERGLRGGWLERWVGLKQGKGYEYRRMRERRYDWEGVLVPES